MIEFLPHPNSGGFEEDLLPLPGLGERRIASLDLVRGVAMILMAIDHVRVYSGIPANGPTFGLFFTRWITNFVAPTFVFLAGTAAFLYGRRFQQRSDLSKFLIVRGLWLVFLELTLLRVCWTFNFDFAHYMLAGVIWMIGICMVILSIAIYMPTKMIGIVGVLVIALHNITDLFQAQLSHRFGDDGANWLLKIFYFGGEIKFRGSGPPLMILYVLIPWVGIIMAGYAFGLVMQKPPAQRRTILLWLGVTLSGFFVALRALDIYGDPRHWSRNHTLVGFFNTTKYPASLQFLLMTLGPMFLLWFFAETWRGRSATVVETFGKVPMFYYLVHIPLIHGAACLVCFIREGRVDGWLFANHPLAAGHAPPGYKWSLGLLYFVYALCVVSLYFACRWYARAKAHDRSGLLKFV